MNLGDKEGLALETVARLLLPGGTARPAVAFGGGKESMVLLHLVRRAAGGLNVPVLTLDPPEQYTGLYYFIDKMTRLWGFRPLSPALVPSAGLPDCERLYPGFGRLAGAAASAGFTHLFTGIRRDEEGVSAGIEEMAVCAGMTLVNPLARFTREDTWDYIARYNLPRCSLYDMGMDKLGCITALGAAGGRQEHPLAGAEDDEAAVKARLNKLGYL